MFPYLEERQLTLAGPLASGVRQMLTLCRPLIVDPDLIMINKPTEDQAPKIAKIVEQVGQY
jgi:ABC-type branched-subunit amino acid transport system ATPase component